MQKEQKMLIDFSKLTPSTVVREVGDVRVVANGGTPFLVWDLIEKRHSHYGYDGMNYNTPITGGNKEEIVIENAKYVHLERYTLPEGSEHSHANFVTKIVYNNNVEIDYRYDANANAETVNTPSDNKKQVPL